MSARSMLSRSRHLAPKVLPREQRDNLFVLAVVALVLAPQMPYQPGWAILLACGVLIWRMWQVWTARALPARWIAHVLLLLSVWGTLSSFGTLLGAQAGGTLVLLLLVLKTLEMRARRDSMVIFFLGFFTLSTLFLHSQALPTALAMLLGLWGLLAALVNAHLPVGRPSLWSSVRLAGQLLLWSTPFVVALFVLFPRLPPLWGLPTESPRAKTGLSEHMQVGNIAQLAQDHSVAMRLRFLDDNLPAPAAANLYFRGPTLSQFDGLRWSEAPPASRPVTSALSPRQAYGIGPARQYEVTLEPHGQRWLMTLDATLQPPQLHRQRALSPWPLQWSSTRPVSEILRYTAQAHLNYRQGMDLTETDQKQYTQLPAESDPRTRAWAEQLRTTHGGHAPTILATALQQLRRGGYRYTLEPLPVQRDTADDFWFGQKAGFCEHIASAFVVLLRAAQIPARVVTGYQGGEVNPLDGWWTIRQSDAHAWAEVWLAGDGWVRMDPTASVSPSRISDQTRLVPEPSLLNTAMDRVVGDAQLLRLRVTWEAMQHYWNQWVLAYSERQQSSVLHWLQQWWQTQWQWLVIGIAATGTAALAWRRWQRRGDPWLALLAQARQRMQAQGIPTALHMDTRALARTAIAQWGPRAAALQTWLLHMERMRYAPAAPGTPSLRELRRAFRALRWPPDSPS